MGKRKKGRNRRRKGEKEEKGIPVFRGKFTNKIMMRKIPDPYGNGIA